jgi:predicted PurR-regulated permease PerM
MLKRWSDFRRQQRAALRASNVQSPTGQTHSSSAHDGAGEQVETPGGSLLTDTLPPEPDAHLLEPDDATIASDGPSPVPDALSPASDMLGSKGRRDYGTAGRPLNRQTPFYVGFVGALGVFAAYGLYRALGQLTQVITLLVVAAFLTLTLDPLVQALGRRGMRRPPSVAIVFAGLVVAFTALGFVVVPPVAQQGGLLAGHAPKYLSDLLSNGVIQDLDSQYHVLGKFQAELQKLVTNGNFMGGVFGGVLGASKALASGFFAILTVLVLTLYFLSSLPRVKEAAYGMVPRSRRPRVMSLSEEIMRRVGSYAIGQVAVATINAILSYVMMSIVGIHYAAVLAVVVGVLGLIPMVGASIGAALVCLVAVFDEPQKAVIALVYYVIYQQVENYVVAPKIMQRTISVPGAVTVIAALVGATLAGVLGALLAMPVAAGLLLIYEEVVLPRQRQN